MQWIKYLFVLLLAAFLTLFYNGYVTGLFLFSVMLYPVAAWLLLMLHRIFLQFSDEIAMIREIPLGGQGEFDFSVRNRSFIPVWNGLATVEWKNRLFGMEKKEKKPLTAAPFLAGEVVFRVDAEHYGLYEAEKSEMLLQDIFCLVQCRKRIKEHPVFLCTPFAEKREVFLPPELSDWIARARRQEGDGAFGQGQETPDVRELRDFQPGDRQNRIHHRVSAKLEHPVVKVLEREQPPGILVVAESDGKEQCGTDRCLEFLCDAGRRFAEEELPFSMLLGREIREIKGEDELREAFLEILSGKGVPSRQELENFFLENADAVQTYDKICWINREGVRLKEF